MALAPTLTPFRLGSSSSRSRTASRSDQSPSRPKSASRSGQSSEPNYSGVQRRSGAYNYQDIDRGQNTSDLSSVYDQAFQQQAKFQDDLSGTKLGYEEKSPLAQAQAYAIRRDADSRYLEAGGPGEQSQSPYSRMMANRVSGTSQYQDIVANRRQRKNAQFGLDLYRQQKEIDSSANEPQRMLDRYMADLASSTQLQTAAIDANARRDIASTQQPLSAGQVLEQSRIENPEASYRAASMNLLGGYANNGTRSNFAYWG